MGKRVLLMYISYTSGHQRASMAVEKALHLLDDGIETKNINSFNYTNPILEKIINRTYMTVIRRRPEVWEYLYDNPVVVKRTQRLKESIHKFNSVKMKELLDDFSPDAVVCTQAFPCGIVADLKKTEGIKLPLIGVLTDYAPHSYWIYNEVDAYVVPSEETGSRLVENGASEERIRVFGTPIDPKFYTKKDRGAIFKKYSLDPKRPVILIMGGGQGLGPIKKLVLLLEKSAVDMQLVVVTGINKRLYNFLNKRAGSFKKRMSVFAFSEDIDEFMEIAALAITKPGGLTTAEALSKTLPLMILNPLPGQEAMNTRYLLKKGLAVKAGDETEAVVLLEELLRHGEKLKHIKRAIRASILPDSSIRTARLVLEMVN